MCGLGVWESDRNSKEAHLTDEQTAHMTRREIQAQQSTIKNQCMEWILA
jgi:hypothetical protein